jgi:hypothetical protein
MASIIQRRLSKAGLSKQSAKGSGAASATYAYGVDGGSIFKLDLQEDEFPLTWSNRDVLGFDRKGVKPGQSTGTLATPNLIGLLLLGVLGADTVTAPNTFTITGVTNVTNPTVTTSAPHGIVAGQTVTIASVGGAVGVNGTWVVTTVPTSTTFTLTMAAPGAYTSGGTVVANYTHTITPAAVVPYLTAWGSFGTADFMSLVDTKASSVELSWEEAGRVMLKQEVPSGVGYFTAGGGVFQVEGNSFQMGGGSIKFDTHINQPISAATVLPADVIEGELMISWSFKIYPTDTGLFRGVYFGLETAGALTGIANVPRLGALSAQFPGPTNDLLTISSPKAKFMVEFPESNPQGGPAELTLAGVSTLPLAGSSVTATLVNAVSGY